MLRSITVLTALVLMTTIVHDEDDAKWELCMNGKGQADIDACTSFMGVNAPHHLAALLNRARQYHNMKNYRDALADYDEAIRLQPDRALSYLDRAVVYSATGNEDESIADNTAVIKLLEK